MVNQEQRNLGTGARNCGDHAGTVVAQLQAPEYAGEHACAWCERRRRRCQGRVQREFDRLINTNTITPGLGLQKAGDLIDLSLIELREVARCDWAGVGSHWKRADVNSAPPLSGAESVEPCLRGYDQQH